MHQTYLERRLDTFPVTSVTVNTRKEIVALIDTFEEHGRLPYRVSEDIRHQYQEEVKPVTNYAKEKARLEAERVQRDEQRKLLLDEEKKRAYIDKKKKEKELRKQQYNTYMQGLKS